VITRIKFYAFHDSPLNALTEKQREVITASYNLGYYNIPKKIDSERLAKKLGIHKSALVDHRRRAEQRLLTKYLTYRICVFSSLEFIVGSLGFVPRISRGITRFPPFLVLRALTII
jgi:hypothetical protein